MPQHHHRSFATSLLLTGLLVLLMSFGAGWGNAYGQTAGPTPTPNTAVLNLTKDADVDQPVPGSTLTFTIRVTNTGNTAARDVVVTDPVPDAFGIGTVTASMGTATSSGQTVTVAIPQLDPGMTAVITIETRVRQDASGPVTNQAVVRAINVNGEVVSDQRAAVDVVISPATGEDDDDPDSTAQPTISVPRTSTAAPATATPPAATAQPGTTAQPTATTQPSASAQPATTAQPTANTGDTGGSGSNPGTGDGSGGQGTGRPGNPEVIIPSQLTNTGADAGLQVPLFVLGLLLMAAGVVIFVRTWKTN